MFFTGVLESEWKILTRFVWERLIFTVDFLQFNVCQRGGREAVESFIYNFEKSTHNVNGGCLGIGGPRKDAHDRDSRRGAVKKLWSGGFRMEKSFWLNIRNFLAKSRKGYTRENGHPANWNI